MKKNILAIIIIISIEMALSLYLTWWRETFWNSVSVKNASSFIFQLEVFTVIALFICFSNGITGYLINRVAIYWRERLNTKALALHNPTTIENSAQRIQEDCKEYPALVLELIFGTIKSLLYVIVFSTALLLHFSYDLFLILIAYAIVGTIISHVIAKPLIKLNYELQRREATYRSNLDVCTFTDCIYIMLGLARKQKHLNYFQSLYAQVGVVLPLIIIAPSYFTQSAMTLGILMRFNSTGSTILDHLSYGINSFNSINRLLACRQRLKEMKVIR